MMFSFCLILFAGHFALISHAQSQAKVSTRSAKIRKEANTNSDVLASVVENDELTVIGQIAGSDGSTWYQVFVDANSKGYIRSDLVKITDGSTPPTVTAESTAAVDNTNQTTDTSATTTTEETAQTTTTENTDSNVAEVNPVSATATSANVRVRASASTGSQIVASVEKDSAMTVNGTCNSTDGKVWYRVNLNVNGSDITGFVRSDLVSLSGELIPVALDAETPEDETEEMTQPETSHKDWDTQDDNGTWYLLDNVGQQRYAIHQFFDLEESATKVQGMYEQELKTVKKQKAIVVVLACLLLLAAAIIVFLIFKLKDLKDDLDFAEMEKAGANRKTADRPVAKKNPAPGNRPGTARPANGKVAQRPREQGQPRPQVARPQGQPRPQNPQAARPQGQGQPRPQNPQATRPQGQGQPRPQNPQAARPQGQGQPRPQAARPQVQGQPRPQAARPQGQGQPRPQNAPAARPAQPAVNSAGPQNNKYANSDDEFEFEFLNWDGDENI
jgi:hypothetical protein